MNVEPWRWIYQTRQQPLCPVLAGRPDRYVGCGVPGREPGHEGTGSIP
jgi:hypothetical protein